MLRKNPEAFFRSTELVDVMEVDGVRHPIIVVSDNTTETAIRAAIPAAVALRDWLVQNQGVNEGGRYDLLEQLSGMQEQGTSYTMIARQINADIETGIRRYEQVDDGHDEGLWQAEYLLNGLGYKQAESEKIVDDAMDNIRRRRKVFPPDFPADRARVIQVLRTWRNGWRHKALQSRGKRQDGEDRS
jgi:hypothetical protein